MNSLIGIVIVVVIAAHLITLTYALLQDRTRRDELLWLGATVLLSATAAATYWLPANVLLADKIGRGFWLVLALAGLIGVFGGLILQDMAQKSKRLTMQRNWGMFVGGWMLLLLIGAAISPTISIGQPNWLITGLASPDFPTLVGVAGALIGGTALLVMGFILFYQSILPEVANRALFWVLETTALLTGVVLIASANEALAGVGMIALVTTMIGAVYAYTRHRVFDIRGSLSRALTVLLMLIFTATLLFGSLYMVTGLELNTDINGLIVLAFLAIGLAALYVPVRELGENLFINLINPPKLDPLAATREFNKQVAQAVELEALAQGTSVGLNRVLGLRRSGLMLVNGTSEQELELVMIPGGSFGPETKGKYVHLNLSSQFYQQVAREQHAVAQFDLEFSPRYRDLNPNAQRFFTALAMSAYAPIIMDKVMVGLLVAGPKINDSSFTMADLDLLTTLAQQTGFALQNARLVADLQHLNASMRSLNRGLEDANRELARLDSVKTDFVTIASHELRTPLAQIRGYTDIIDSVNEQGMLEQEQTTVLVTNLRKATERMEELISNMLDVSQLDVNAMDLRFSQTTIDTVMRLAIEPLTDAIKQRKQSLMVRGVRGLPAIEGDLQRLVQAFRNVIVNGIKFTPDGGRIEITASQQPAQVKEGVDHILVSITDTGVGIDPANLELIFKKFYRTYDPSLHSTGTYKFLGAGPGLGLTIAKGVIESHGGRIWAESEGHSMEKLPGTTFYILLPTIPPRDVRKSITFETNSKMPLKP